MEGLRGWKRVKEADDIMNFDPLSPERANPARRALVALVSTVCRFPRLVLTISAALVGLSVFGAAACLQYHTQRNDLISAKKECQQRWRKYIEEFGDDDDIVVVVKGADRAAMERALDDMAARIRKQPALFDRLFYKVDLRPLRNRALLFLPTEQIRTICDDYLADMGRLLDHAPLSWHALGMMGLVQEARARTSEIMPGQALTKTDDRLLTQLLAISRSARETLADPNRYSDPWSSLTAGSAEEKDQLEKPQYFFSGDGTLAFLLCRPVKEAGSFTAARQSVAALREQVNEARTAHPEVEIGLTGLPVLETDEMVAAERDTKLASFLAIGGVTLLFLVVYRGVAYPALTVATLLAGTAWAMGWLTLTVGHLNILSATFAVMLIGMGDYGVLWVMRYEQARKQGSPVREALLHTTTHVAIGNLTAASTLALAFFAAALADFKAVAELGWIAGCGVLLCALACFTVLPALLMVFDRRGQMTPERVLPFEIETEGRRDRWLPGLVGRAPWVLGGGLALTLVLAVCAGRVRYDHNLLHLQARNLDSVQWEMTLIEHTAGASWHALSYTDTPQQALALKKQYEKLPGVSRVVEVASLVPADQATKLPMLQTIRERLAKLPPRGKAIGHPLTDLHLLLDELQELATRIKPLAAAHGASTLAKVDLLKALQVSLRELSAELKKARHESPSLAQERLREFDQKLAGGLAENLHRLREVATPATISVADLPPALRERFIGRNGKWLLRVFARDCLWDFEPLAHFTEQIRTVDAEATGKPFGTVEGLKAMKNGLQRAGFYAFLVIVLVLWLDFRTPRATVAALLPLLLGILLTLGVMGLLGVPLNPANMIAFPLILGVGVDNGVHVLHDWLIRRREGRAGVSRAIGRGVLVKALTTMIGFGTLMISSERGLVGLGFILTLGVGCSMLAALVLLPSGLQVAGKREAQPVEGALEPAHAAQVAA
jgi:hopanoid biosynthesis associated RND transporter like protein HpnN